MSERSFIEQAPSWKFLIPIILVALLLRVNGIQHYGLWGDEQASMQVATGQSYVEDTISTYTNLQLRTTDRFSGVIRSTINDNGNSVLYNVALHYWMVVFGRSDLAVRSLSLLLGICIIPVAFRFSKVLIGSVSAAYLAAAFVAFHPLVVGYAQEARAYSMALLFSFISSLFLLEGMSRKVSWAKFFYLYFATLIVALLSQYLAVYVLGAQLIVVAIGLREKRKWMLLGGGLLVVLFVIGLWFLVGGAQGLQVLRDQNQMHRLQAEAYRSCDPPYALPVDPQNIATGMVQVWLEIFGNRIQDMGLRIREIGVLLLIPFVMIAGLVANIRRKHQDGLRPFYILLAFIGAQAVFAVIASIRAGHCLAFLPQYGLFVVPYAMVLLAWSVPEALGPSGRSRSITIIAFIAYSSVCLLRLKVTYSNPLGKFPARNEALEAARTIEVGYAPGDTVLVRSRMEARSINLYLAGHSAIIQKIVTSLPVMCSIRKPR